MEFTIFIIVGIYFVIYMVSAIFMYWFIQSAYREGGVWYNVEPSNVDIVVVLLPFLNSVAMLFMFIYGWYPKEHNNNMANRFFKLKK